MILNYVSQNYRIYQYSRCPLLVYIFMRQCAPSEVKMHLVLHQTSLCCNTSRINRAPPSNTLDWSLFQIQTIAIFKFNSYTALTRYISRMWCMEKHLLFYTYNYVKINNSWRLDIKYICNWLVVHEYIQN